MINNFFLNIIKIKNVKIKTLLLIASFCSIFIMINIFHNSDLFCTPFNIIENKNYLKCPLLFNLTAKLLNEKPNSIETMYLLDDLIKFLQDDKTLNYFEPIYDKYDFENIASIGNVNESTGEKIMIALLLGFGIEKPTTGPCTHEFQITAEKGMKFANDILNNCNDKNFKAIIEFLFILGRLKMIDNSKDINNFIANYPNHNFITLLNLYKLYNDLGENTSKDQYNKIIAESLKFAKEYQSIITPYGYSIADEYYYLICVCYFKINDIKKSTEYLSILKKDNYKKDKIEKMSQKLDYFR